MDFLTDHALEGSWAGSAVGSNNTIEAGAGSVGDTTWVAPLRWKGGIASGAMRSRALGKDADETHGRYWTHRGLRS
jgi:hypothetical protein